MMTLASGKSMDVSPTLLIQIVRNALRGRSQERKKSEYHFEERKITIMSPPLK